VITAQDIVSSRVAIGFAAERLVDLAGRMKLRIAQHCVVLDNDRHRVLGVIRLIDVAGRISSGNRILSDLVSEVLPPVVRDHEPAAVVAELFQRQGVCEAIVLSETGGFVGLITAESAFDWLQQEQRAARQALEELVAERERLNEILEKKVEQRTAELRGALEEFKMASLALSHDVRAPLRSIQQLAEILATGECGPLNPDGVFHAQSIKRHAARLELMADEILDKAERAFAVNSPRIEAVDLNTVLDDVMEFHRALLSQRHAIVNKRGQLHPVAGRYVPLLQIVANLLANAIHYVPATRQPLIEIWSEESPDHVNLCIKDNGLGFAPRHQGQIFEPFIRLPHVARPGFGLGLAIAKRAVLLVGGHIGVTSEEGRGSLFTVRLQKPTPAASVPSPL
jgi:signal transduction histidine kinase